MWDALTTINHLHNFQSVYLGEEEEDVLGDYIEFVACGKNEELDSDMNYALSTKLIPEKRKSPEEVGAGEEQPVEKRVTAKEYNYIEPRQKPIDPPYMAFLQKRNDLNNHQ